MQQNKVREVFGAARAALWQHVRVEVNIGKKRMRKLVTPKKALEDKRGSGDPEVGLWDLEAEDWKAVCSQVVKKCTDFDPECFEYTFIKTDAQLKAFATYIGKNSSKSVIDPVLKANSLSMSGSKETKVERIIHHIVEN